MMRVARLLLIAGLFFATIAAFGCTKTVLHKKAPSPAAKASHPGPPPHAPAHGYRHKHSDGAVLVYKSDVGVYVVSGHADIYFHKDRYYRLRDGNWKTSVHIGGPWHEVAVKKLPAGLQKKSNKSNKGKDKKSK
jgi:hypothetical protein